MARWIPMLATVGLVSIMAMPAPGLWGLLIGVACTLAIILSALLWLLDQIVTQLARHWDRKHARRRRVHAGSGMMRKAGAPTPAPVLNELPRPSPVQERARVAALRREASKLEPFRVR